MDLSSETSSVCYVCNERHPNDIILTFADHHVCSGCKEVYLQAYQEGVPVPREFTLGRVRNVLVLSPGNELPDRCVRCNAPTAKRPQVFNSLGPRSQATGGWSVPLALDVGTCQKCLGKRKAGLFLIIVGAVIFAMSFLSFFFIDKNPFLPQVIIHGGQLLSVLFIAPGWAMRRSLRIARIKDENLFILGASDAFLNTLPDLKRRK
jgi:hypothetical protein